MGIERTTRAVRIPAVKMAQDIFTIPLSELMKVENLKLPYPLIKATAVPNMMGEGVNQVLELHLVVLS